jgi:hypothetical protein
MCLCDVVDEFLNQHGLAHTGTTKETNLSATCIRREKINDLDTGFQNLGRCRLVHERRGIGMNRREPDAVDGPTFVNGFTNHIHDASQSRDADGYEDGRASVDDWVSTDKTFGSVHSNGADGIFTQVLCYLEDEPSSPKILNFECIQDGRKIIGVELNVDDRTNDGFYVASGRLGISRI